MEKEKRYRFCDLIRMSLLQLEYIFLSIKLRQWGMLGIYPGKEIKWYREIETGDVVIKYS